MRFIVFLVLVLALVACVVQGHTPNSCDSITCLSTCLEKNVHIENNLRGIQIGVCVSETKCECQNVSELKSNA